MTAKIYPKDEKKVLVKPKDLREVLDKKVYRQASKVYKQFKPKYRTKN